MRTFVILLSLSSLLAACDDHPTRVEFESSINDVKQHVAAVDERQVAGARDVGFRVSATTARLRIVETKQKNSGEVIAAMGDGFNQLSESVQVADEKATKTARRQHKLEKQVHFQLSPANESFVSADAEKPTVYFGDGRDLQGREVPKSLLLVFGSPGSLQIVDDPGTKTNPASVETIGDRIYATGGALVHPICFDIIQRIEESVEFQAARCDDSFIVYQFRPQ